MLRRKLQQLAATVGLTYRDSGVDVDAGNELVRRIAPLAASTRRAEMLSGIGGFAALASLPTRYREPILVTGTDGVGTKLRLAIDYYQHDHIGEDLVAMCVNDVLVTGAEPLLFLDYYATGALDVDIAERVIAGIARGCSQANCALAGGETAEMPGFHRAGDYELAGFCVGVVERSDIISGETIAPGDLLIGLPSSGLHANGYSLVRRVMDDRAIAPDESLLAQLLAPTRIYVKLVLELLRNARAGTGVKGMCHITGGGFVDNLPRMFGDHLSACIDLHAWRRPDIFALLQQAGDIDEMEMLRTFNNGIGFVLCVAEEQGVSVLEELRDAGEQAVVIGRMVASDAAPAAGTLLVSAAGAQLV